MNKKIQIPKPFQPLFKPKRYKVYYGGRGAGKSWSFALCLLIIGSEKRTRVLCAREIQSSMRESVHKLLVNCIEILGLECFYRVTRDSIVGLNGTEIIFHGIRHDPMQIKSLEGIDICWIEEAQKVSNESWDVLIPTIRKKGSEIWISFNPSLETDPTYTKFVKADRTDALVRKVNFNENPYFSDELRAELEYLKEVNYVEYMHIWEGDCQTFSHSQIFRDKFVVQDFKVPSDAVFYYGLDWGFSQDPTVILRCCVNDNCLYIDYEAGGRQVELDNTYRLIDTIPNAKSYTIRADSARPESISFIRRQGYKMESVYKWSGSVEDGVEFIRSFRKVFIHTRCTETASEFTRYSYKVDRVTGDILPQIVDAHNHYIDALRYALQPMIKQRGKPRLANVIGA